MWNLKRSNTNKLTVSGQGESKRTPPQEPPFLEASPMAKASLLRKGKKKRNKQTNQKKKKKKKN